MIGLLQWSGSFIVGATMVILGIWVAKDLFMVAGTAVTVVGLVITGMAISALADYPLWQAVLAVCMMLGIGCATVTLVARVPWFQLHPDE